MITLRPLPERPLVSIVVPSFNQGRYIRATLESILAQDYRPVEVIVVDGGSSDETLDVLRSLDHVPELRWVSEADRGQIHAVNKGFARATGDICAVQSSDDLYLPGAISAAVDALRHQPEVALVYGDVVHLHADGTEYCRERLRPYSLTGLLSRHTYIPQPTCFFRMDAVRQLGGWDERILYCSDTDFWFRLALRGTLRKIDGYWGCHRIHPDQRDAQRAKIWSDYHLMTSQLQDLATAPLRVRRAARAGLHLLALRYGPSRSPADLRREVLRAAVAYPPCLLSPTVPKELLLPGYSSAVGLARRAWRGVKRLRRTTARPDDA